MLTHMLSYLSALARRDDGATMVEYGLMVALIAIVALGTVTILGGSVTTIFCNISNGLIGGSC